MLKAALCGNYVNFGVFRLYGDDSLEKALNMFIKLLISIPLKNLLVSSTLSADDGLAYTPHIAAYGSDLIMRVFQTNRLFKGKGLISLYFCLHWSFVYTLSR